MSCWQAITLGCPLTPAHSPFPLELLSHSSCQLSCLCQRFKRTSPVKASYLAAILIFPFSTEWDVVTTNTACPNQRSPRLKKNYPRTSHLLWPWDSTVRTQVRRPDTQHGLWRTCWGLAATSCMTLQHRFHPSFSLLLHFRVLPSPPILSGPSSLFLLPEARPSLGGFPAMLQVTYYPSSSPVQSFLEYAFLPRKSAYISLLCHTQTKQWM